MSARAQQKRPRSPGPKEAPVSKKLRTRDDPRKKELYEAPELRGLSPMQLSQYMLRRVKRFAPELSSVELADMIPSESAYYDASSIDIGRTLPDLPAFVGLCTGSSETLEAISSKNGQPNTLVITSSGVRATELVRTLRTILPKNMLVAKLFAKHIKLKEALEMCRTTRFGIATGTPQRILELILQGALQLDTLDRVILDASYVDQKKRTILDYKELQEPLLKVLRIIQDRKQLLGGEHGTGLIMF